MPMQLALAFDAVPVTCEVQARYHAIAPCLAGVASPAKQAQALNLGYSTITRWLREFRADGLPGLFPETHYPREPYTPERIIVQLLYFKCCAPKAGDRELVRVVEQVTGHRLSHHTVKTLCERFFFWRHAEFQKLVRYPKPQDPLALRQEIVRLHQQGWTELCITELLRVSRKAVRKWLQRAQAKPGASLNPATPQLALLDLSRAPHQPARKGYLGAIHATLTLQKKYGYAGWFRIKGYLEADYRIYLKSTTIKKIMALNRRVHLAPVRPVKIIEPRDIREGPPKSRQPFEHTFIDLRYLDAKPEGVQLYSCLSLEGFSRTILAGSLTPEQEVGVVLQMYFQVLLRWGLWEEVLSDHGGQFQSHAFARANRRLGIQHVMYEKGHPWQNLIELLFRAWKHTRGALHLLNLSERGIALPFQVLRLASLLWMRLQQQLAQAAAAAGTPHRVPTAAGPRSLTARLSSVFRVPWRLLKPALRILSNCLAQPFSVYRTAWAELDL